MAEIFFKVYVQDIKMAAIIFHVEGTNIFQPFDAYSPKMVRHTLRILQHLLQDF